MMSSRMNTAAVKKHNHLKIFATLSHVVDCTLVIDTFILVFFVSILPEIVKVAKMV